MKIPKELTTVTPLSKFLAMGLFVALPIISFFIGTTYQEELSRSINVNFNNLGSTETTQYTSPGLKTYINKIYKYQLEHPVENTFNRHEETYYSMTDFNAGCTNIIAVPHKFPMPNLSIPLEEILLFDFQQQGFTKNSSEKYGNYLIVKFTYTKGADKMIGGYEWDTVHVTNNYENHGDRTVYFLIRNGSVYFINSLSGGPCPDEEQLLSSFRFIK